jgi:predicted nucleotidyltransferase component of viral defense system
VSRQYLCTKVTSYIILGLTQGAVPIVYFSDKNSMDFKDIRRIAITGLFSDEVLLEKLVLKGGNALDIVYQLGSRSSLDIDLSIDDDFPDLDDAKLRIFNSLRNAFESYGYVVFDLEFNKRPSFLRPGQPPDWGGYEVVFKLTSTELFENFQNDVERLRRTAQTVAPEQQRRFKIEISKFEFCGNKIPAELAERPIYVYSLPMIAIEKLRAICQQMGEYPNRAHPRPRARDFFDIHTVAISGLTRIATEENLELLHRIFATKDVSLSLLDRVADYREFHRPDWDAVIQATSEHLEAFDYYFDYVLGLIDNLKAVRIK